jgi:lipid-A-disaccharide synthase
MALRVVISAGEVSGDQHLARVVRALRELDPEVQVRGMGGKECRAAGAELVVDCYKSGSAMGFLELFRSARGIFSSFSAMSSLIRSWKTDVVILVDYPDFNLRLARVAHEAGCYVLYYIPPKVWAWRSGRVEKIKKFINQVAAIFPFERSWYRQQGYDAVTYVGHPLLDENRFVSPPQERDDTVLFMPGSRKFEIERMLLPMLIAFERMRKQKPRLRATVLLAENMSEEWATQQAATAVSADTLSAIDWKRGNVVPEMQRARAAILKSGTCNLEGAIAELPFVSVYSGTLLAKSIVKMFVRMKEYSPVNIMKAGTVRELMRVRQDPVQMERELLRVFEDGPVRQKMIADLRDVRSALFGVDDGAASTATAAQRVARIAVEAAQKTRRVA